MLDSIIAYRAKDNPLLISTTKSKLALKGIDPNRFNATSADDPAVMARVRIIALEWEVKL
jgi:hypothetical protein